MLVFKLRQAVRWLYFLIIFVLLTACDEPQSVKRDEPHQPTSEPIASSTEQSRILTRGIYAKSFMIDPHQVRNSAESAPVRDLFTGLMIFNEKGEVVPALVADWFSEDGQDWLLVLKDEKWSNNQPITAHDFVLSWQRLVDPNNHSLLAHYLVYMGVENAKSIIQGEKSPQMLGVVALNDQSLRIRLSQPNFQLPKMLAHVALLPTYQGKAPQIADLVSNGAYQLLSSDNEQLLLQARAEQTPFQQVKYQLLDDNADPAKIDLIENPRASLSQDVVFLPRLCNYFYEFNFADEKLKEKTVRQAIKAMLSSVQLPENTLKLHAVLPHSFQIAEEKAWAPVVIEQLLKQSGIQIATPLNLTLTFDNQSADAEIANQIIRILGQSELFRIKAHAVDWTQLLFQHAEKQFQLIRSGWCADYPDATQFLMPFHSASPNNKSGYSNAHVDKWLTELQITVSEQERQRLIQQIVYQLDEDVVILPLFQFQRKIKLNPLLKGVESTNNSEVIYSKDIYRFQP